MPPKNEAISWATSVHTVVAIPAACSTRVSSAALCAHRPIPTPSSWSSSQMPTLHAAPANTALQRSVGCLRSIRTVSRVMVAMIEPTDRRGRGNDGVGETAETRAIARGSSIHSLLADQMIRRDDGGLLRRQRDRIEVGGAAEVAGAVEDHLVGAVAAAYADAGVALDVRAGRVAGARRRALDHGRTSTRSRLARPEQRRRS